MTFKLQPYNTIKSRYHCPQCNHRAKTFVRYIDIQTGLHLADNVGRCGREDKCGYHYKPRDYFADNPAQGRNKRQWQPGSGVYPFRRPMGYVQAEMPPPAIKKPAAPETICYIDNTLVNASLAKYQQNNFVTYLIKKYGFEAADRLVARYRIGTSKHWPGAAIFWQLDTTRQARTGKIMLYNAQTGKRVKEPFNYIAWVHVLLNRKSECGMRNEGEIRGWEVQRQNEQGSNNSATGTPLSALKKTSAVSNPHSAFILKQCLFGEHLLTENPNATVAVVESEKTAILASHHAPQYIWVATGCASNLNPQLCQALAGRNVILYPDLGVYYRWKAIAEGLQAMLKGSRFAVSNMLEQLASDEDRDNGLDLGDFL